MVSFITTHVLDSVAGRPAAGIDVVLERLDAEWSHVASGTTNDGGRLGHLGPDTLPGGTYRITFHTGGSFAKTHTPTFYPEVTLTVVIDASEKHYHVPILLSPFAFSTYRGS